MWSTLKNFFVFLQFAVYGLWIFALELDIPFKVKSLLGFVKGKRTNAQTSLSVLLERTLKDYKELRDSGKVHPEKRYAIITGANSGIGLETAKSLVDVGYNIIMACRSAERGREAVKLLQEHVKKCNSTSKVVLMQCDLSSFGSVNKFVEQVKEQKLAVNLLVCNAGVMAPPLSRTKEGYESQLGSNYLAHFLMVQQLLNTLKENGPSRIVIVASEAHRTGYIHWDDINFEKSYNPYLGYTQSKVCLIMFAYELHRYLKSHFNEYEDKITVNVLHPGVIGTNIGSNLFFPVNHLVNNVLPYLAMNPTEGSVTTVYLCLSSEVEKVSGKYFDHCQPKQSSYVTYDKQAANELWQWSMQEITKHTKTK